MGAVGPVEGKVREEMMLRISAEEWLDPSISQRLVEQLLFECQLSRVSFNFAAFCLVVKLALSFTIMTSPLWCWSN